MKSFILSNYYYFLIQVLELSENYCPEISDYFQGRITEVLPSGDVTIDLIGNLNIIKMN